VAPPAAFSVIVTFWRMFQSPSVSDVIGPVL
jgi:hypothetical protein